MAFLFCRLNLAHHPTLREIRGRAAPTLIRVEYTRLLIRLVQTTLEWPRPFHILLGYSIKQHQETSRSTLFFTPHLPATFPDNYETTLSTPAIGTRCD